VGYKYSDLNLNDLMEVISQKGYRRLVMKNIPTGIKELYESLTLSAYVKELQSYIPEIQTHMFESKKESGVRALAVNEDGKLVDDFVIEVKDSVIHVRNAPSPAATSSLSIAEYVVNISQNKFKLK
jgi:L-2-hydroxyglutarate oxidase LhgO